MQKENTPSWLHEDASGVIMTLRIVPGSRSESLSVEEPLPKLKIRQRAIEGAANRGLILFLSELLDIPKTSITILQGERSRQKRVRISGLSVEQIRDRCNVSTAADASV